MRYSFDEFSRFGRDHTLKLKITAMAVVTGVLAALATTQLVLWTTRASIQRMLVHSESDNVERTAALLGTKVDMLRDALKAVVRQAPPDLWDSTGTVQRYLVDNQGLNALFESVVAVRTDGAMLARMVKDASSSELQNIADRTYFQQALKTDQSIVSEPLVGKVAKTPIVVIAMATRTRDHQATGVIAGVLTLQSTNLFAEVTRTVREEGSRVLIMNRAGVLLAHTNTVQLLKGATEEPGLTKVFERWRDVGSPIDTTGTAFLSEGHLVAMAGIPDSDWTLVRLTPLATAMQPVQSAQTIAWQAAAGVGLLAAFLAGAMAWRLTRPISNLRARANKLLLEGDASTVGWPQDGGEVGQLARAFQQVVEQRQQKQAETLALLVQLEAVLDHAEVGIAFTRNGHFEMLSHRFCQIFHFDKQHTIGQPTHLMHPSPEAYRAFSERAHPVFMEHGRFDGEVQLARSTGELFWAHMRGRAVMPGDRLQGTIWTVEDITASREQRERLAWTSSHDSLTGLVNRPAFEELLARATEHASSQPFCAMFIDLDHFKQVNDGGGHAAGDALLRDVAQVLTAQVRQTDTVARMGGDEFAILLEGCPLEQALEIGEKLRSAVLSYQLPWADQIFSIGISVGLVAVDSSYPSAAAVLRAADIACYTAKERGRNRVAVFDRRAPLA